MNQKEVKEDLKRHYVAMMKRKKELEEDGWEVII